MGRNTVLPFSADGSQTRQRLHAEICTYELVETFPLIFPPSGLTIHRLLLEQAEDYGLSSEGEREDRRRNRRSSSDRGTEWLWTPPLFFVMGSGGVEPLHHISSYRHHHHLPHQTLSLSFFYTERSSSHSV